MGGSIARGRGAAAYRRAAHAGGVRNTVAPAITGTAQVGATLTVSNGTWSGSPTTFARQWKRGALNIGNGGTTYVPVPADVGFPITCEVTASTANGGNAKKLSNATANVIAA